MRILILVEPSNNIYQIQAEKDTIALLLAAGHSPVSSNLSYLSVLNFYQFIDRKYIEDSIANLFHDVDCIFIMNKLGQHGFVSSVIEKIKENGGSPQIVTDLFAINSVEGYHSIRSMVRDRNFETIAPNGRYIRKVFSND